MAENILTKGEGLPGWGKAIIFIGGGAVVVIVGFKVYNVVKKKLGEKESKAEIKDVKQDLKDLEEKGIKKSFADSVYSSTANQIFTAMDGWGTDNGAVTGAIFKMKNDADMLALIEAFGTRTISSGRGNPEPDFTGTLPAAITSELPRTPYDIVAAINKRLSEKGIKYRF